MASTLLQSVSADRKKLYDRDDQMKELLEAYGRSCSHSSGGGREIVIVAGPSGVGKTALASRLKDRVAEDGGYFASGKFDQLAANSQATAQLYGPFFAAVTDLCRQVVASGEQAIASIKVHLENQLHAVELSMLKETLPAMSLLYTNRRYSFGVDEDTINNDNNAATLYNRITSRGADAENCFINIFCKFVHVFCSGRQQPPLVFLLDDIQWANPKSLALIKALAATEREATRSKLLLVCTCRNDEAFGREDLDKFKCELTGSGVVVANIEVLSMSEVAVSEMIADLLQIPLDECKTLADVVYRKTDGNVLFVVQLLACLQDDRILSKDGSGRWQWDNDVIVQAFENQTVVELLINKINHLPESTIEVMQIASCVGVAFSKTVLCSVGTLADADVVVALRQAEESGLLIVDHALGNGRFAHDKIQQAVYSLIPENNLALFHLNIGRRLFKGLAPKLLESNLLLVADQISRGIHLMEDTEEKAEYAEFYLRAGIKAALLSAFTTSATFLNTGIALLGSRRWRDHYTLTLNLYNTAAEIDYYNGSLDRVDALVQEVFLRSRNFEDSLRAHFTHIYSLGTRNEMLKGLDEAFGVLKELGESFPRQARFYHIQGALVNCRQMLRNQRDADIMNLPAMRDKKKLAALRLLLVVSANAFYVKKEFLPLFCARIVSLTLQYGISNMCCVGFATLSLLFAIRGEVEHAYRTCRLALQTVEKCDAKEWQARVAVCVYGGIFSLKHPYRDSIEPLLQAHRSGLVLGDTYSSFLSALLYCRIALFGGVLLPQLVKEMYAYRDLCRQRSLHVVSLTLEANLLALLALMSMSPEALAFTDANLNEENDLLKLKKANPVNYLTVLFFKTFFALYMNDLTRCQALLTKVRQEQFERMLPFTLCFHYFLEGVASSRLSSSSSQERKHANRCLRKLKSYAFHCPENFQNKVYLVEAELAASGGHVDEAVKLFQQSIEIAGRQQFFHEQGLGYEGAGYALKRCGRMAEAKEYFHQACTCYSLWGAQAKADQLSNLTSQF